LSLKINSRDIVGNLSEGHVFIITIYLLTRELKESNSVQYFDTVVASKQITLNCLHKMRAKVNGIVSLQSLTQTHVKEETSFSFKF